MEILLAGLLCYFISAISALAESNSSLLESKSLPASSSSEVPPARLLPLSSYVVIIWKKQSRFTVSHVHCFAGISNLNNLVTSPSCALQMAEIFKQRGENQFPNFFVTIKDLSGNTLQTVNIEEPWICQGSEIAADKVALIPLPRSITLPGIDETHEVPYQKEDENELDFFTYGLPTGFQQDSENDVVKIQLQPMLGGYVTNLQHSTHDPVEGAPLYENGKLWGVYATMTESPAQDEFYPQTFVYKFIPLQKPASPPKEKKKKKKKSGIIEIKNQVITNDGHAENVGIYGFKNKYYYRD